MRPTICATPSHFNQSHAQVITSPNSSSSRLSRNQCNMIPLKLYKLATWDKQTNDVTKCNSWILAFGGSRLSVVGEVPVRVWRGNYKWILFCKLVDIDNIRAIMGRKACVGMEFIQYTRSAKFRGRCLADQQSGITEKYDTVFGDGIGELEGEYRIRLDDTVDPILHAHAEYQSL